jgi:bifunctional non-homologous end joining protein LigD
LPPRWNVPPQVDFLARLPVRAVLVDGDVVAFGADAKPDFVSVCEQMLHGRAEIPLTYVIFDVLTVERRDLRREPYRERRQIFAGLGLSRPHWCVPDAFDDGKALWAAVCEHELEGLAAKRLNEPYRADERRWVKVKNRAYWRYELDWEGAIRSRQRAAPALALP